MLMGILYFVVWIGLLGLFVALSPRHRRWFPQQKVILITGASSGIGAELARQYAAAEAHLILAARRDDLLQTVAKQCTKLGAASVLTRKCDVADERECKDLMNAVREKHDKLDCLVLNAGVSFGVSLEEADDMALYERVMKVNYFGSIYCTKYALPLLKQGSKGARIAVISSGLGVIGMPYRSGYCASKFALHGFFESVRLEIEPKYGIVVSMICPGVVDTDIDEAVIGNNPMVFRKSKAMSVEKAGDLIVGAISRGWSEYHLTYQQSLAVKLKAFFPTLVHRMSLRMFKQTAIRRNDNKKKA